jgi:signal transduction histidine kinase
VATKDDRVVKREQALTWVMRATAAVGAVSVVALIVVEVATSRMSSLPLTLSLPIAFFLIGLFVWWRAPRHPVARRMLAVTTVLVVFTLNSQLIAHLLPEPTSTAEIARRPQWILIYSTVNYVFFGILVVLIIRLIALLPDGHYRFTYERSLFRVLWLLPLPLAGISPKLGLMLMALGPVLLVVRYVHLPAAQRRTLRWLLGMAILFIGAILVPLMLELLARGRTPHWVEPAVGLLAIAVVSAALVTMLVRHRSLGIDLRIPWTTRYGLLWLIFGLWILAVAGIVSAQTRTAVPVVVAVVALVVTYSIRLSAELATRAAQVQQQAHELAASRARIVRAQDSERRRIERDLHDGIQQELVALVAKLRLARNKLPPGADQAGSMLTEVQNDTYRVIDQLRELSHGIHPPELSDQGLVAAVQSLARRTPITVTALAEPPVDTTRYATDIEESAFFVVSEALTNVLKHAHASHAAIRLSLTGESLLVEITDDGTGIPAGTDEGSGLTGLRDRVGATGGQLEIRGTPDGGTTVQARLPAHEVPDG